MKRCPLPFWILALVALLLGPTACDRGPLEKAGKAVDRAVEKTGGKIDDSLKK